ncbi:MAG: ATP-binding cassette domain-containing protein [Gammaproteobacteria bacterium]
MDSHRTGQLPPSDSTFLIRARGVRLGYGAQTVLDSVELQVGAGEFWFLLGRNGTGKSTFLKALLGLIKPRSGCIVVHPALAQREWFGFVPQSSAFNPALPTTVREFVLLAMAGLSMGRKEESRRLSAALASVGLQGTERRDYWSLSDGQRQRVLVARALARNPRLLIMDEPTNGLDVACEAALLEHLAKLNREEALSLLFVSHNLATATRYATHVALFHDRGVTAGRASHILTSANLKHVYGVSLDDIASLNQPSPPHHRHTP